MKCKDNNEMHVNETDRNRQNTKKGKKGVSREDNHFIKDLDGGWLLGKCGECYVITMQEDTETALSNKTRECVPFTLMLSASIHTATNGEPLFALFDFGSTHI